MWLVYSGGLPLSALVTNQPVTLVAACYLTRSTGISGAPLPLLVHPLDTSLPQPQHPCTGSASKGITCSFASQQRAASQGQRSLHFFTPTVIQAVPISHTVASTPAIEQVLYLVVPID